MPTSSSTMASPSAADTLVDAVVLRAEHRRAKLEELSDVGLALAKEIRRRAAAAPDGAEPRHEPARAFSIVARSVRLTLAFEAKIDEQIIALSKGEATPFSPTVATVAAPVPSAAPLRREFSKDSACPRRNRVRDAVWTAIGCEIDNSETARALLDELHERLIEREDYEDHLFRPWREAVEAICVDLGLHPDWSRWSDVAGFSTEGVPRHIQWHRFWTYSPERATSRGRRETEHLAGVGPPAR